jgi:hypothetical protein
MVKTGQRCQASSDSVQVRVLAALPEGSLIRTRERSLLVGECTHRALGVAYPLQVAPMAGWQSHLASTGHYTPCLAIYFQ